MSNKLLISILNFQKAFIPKMRILKWSNVKKVHHTGFLYDDHDWMNRRKCNVNYSVLQNQNRFN